MNRLRGRFLGVLTQLCENYSLCLWQTHYRKLGFTAQFFAIQTLKKMKYRSAVKLSSILSRDRNLSTSSEDEDRKKKPTLLMKFEPVLRPEVFLSLKNWILAKFIIQPYLDNDFILKEFTGGAKQALGVVSSYLSQGDFQSLKGLVADEALSEIQRNFALLNVKERQELFVKVTDVLFAFPFQVGIFFDDSNQRRFAEINVVYHCMTDFEELKLQGAGLSDNSKEDVKICNYRFIREYTKGVQSDWIINRLGHFKLCHFEN